MSILNLFPARIPIGLVQPDGTVLMTPEFVRAMTALFKRVGGPDGMGADDLAILASVGPQPDFEARRAIAELAFNVPLDQSVALASLASQIVDLQAQVVQFELVRAELAETRKTLESAALTSADWPTQVASLKNELEEIRSMAISAETIRSEIAELRKSLEGVEIQATFRDVFRVDWEHPGAIGSLTASAGAFTTLTASQTVTLSPTNANVVMSPTGTGVVTINPATAGAIDNMDIGATTPKTGKFTTMQSTGGAGFNGAAPQTAYASGGALAAYGAGANGLDTAAHMSALHALVVSIRAALVANGIMS